VWSQRRTVFVDESVRIDLVMGAKLSAYTQGLVSRLDPSIDVKLLYSKSYATSVIPRIYGMVDHIRQVHRHVRRDAIAHIDTHRLAYLLALPIQNPVVITCNDVLSFRTDFIDWSYDAMPVWLRRLTRRALIEGMLHADAIVCPSDFTRRELVSFMPRLERKIVIVPWAVDTETFSPRDKTEALRRLGLPSDTPVVLLVGTESPRKNLERFLRAFARVVENNGALLVKIGAPREPLRSRLIALGKALGITSHIRFIDTSSTEDLADYYAAADIFVQPSLYEGFGIPPLEAMASGTPVVASDIPSLREVLDAAAWFFDPSDEDEIAGAMLEMIENRLLQEDFRSRGIERARSYAWSFCVSSYVKIYERLHHEWQR